SCQERRDRYFPELAMLPCAIDRAFRVQETVTLRVSRTKTAIESKTEFVEHFESAHAGTEISRTKSYRGFTDHLSEKRDSFSQHFFLFLWRESSNHILGEGQLPWIKFAFSDRTIMELDRMQMQLCLVTAPHNFAVGPAQVRLKTIQGSEDF